jgi:hypothetical protein
VHHEREDCRIPQTIAASVELPQFGTAFMTRRDPPAVMLVRAGSARRREPLVLSGHERSTSANQHRRLEVHPRLDLGRRSSPALGSNPTSPAAEHPAHDARASGWFEEEGRWGTTMPVTRDSPSIQGDVPGPDPARAPPTKAVAGGARLSGAAGGGLPCLGKVRDAERRCPRSRRGWSTFGPHASGAERLATVSSGLQR